MDDRDPEHPRLGWRAVIHIAKYLCPAVLAVALVLIALTLILDRPIPWTPFGATFMVTGSFFVFLWVLGIVIVIDAALDRRDTGQRWSYRVGGPGVTELFGAFKQLDRRLAIGLAIAAAAGILASLGSSPFMGPGATSQPEPDCRYPLSNHGSITCVSKTEYWHYGAAQQRLFLGGYVLFLTIETGFLWRRSNKESRSSM